jgi:nitrite reductase/ring-hydroxylating ferredoxin subunit
VTQTHAPVGLQRFLGPRTSDIPPGGKLIVIVGDREVGLYNVDGEFFAVLNRCPHLGGPLCEGQDIGLVTARVPGEIELDPSARFITCPWHNWEFDLRTGQSYWNPNAIRARHVPVEVLGGSNVSSMLQSGALNRIPGPYQAETYEVAVEDEFVVIQIRPRPQSKATVTDSDDLHTVTTDGKHVEHAS